MPCEVAPLSVIRSQDRIGGKKTVHCATLFLRGRTGEPKWSQRLLGRTSPWKAPTTATHGSSMESQYQQNIEGTVDVPLITKFHDSNASTRPVELLSKYVQYVQTHDGCRQLSPSLPSSSPCSFSVVLATPRTPAHAWTVLASTPTHSIAFAGSSMAECCPPPLSFGQYVTPWFQLLYTDWSSTFKQGCSAPRTCCLALRFGKVLR